MRSGPEAPKISEIANWSEMSTLSQHNETKMHQGFCQSKKTFFFLQASVRGKLNTDIYKAKKMGSGGQVFPICSSGSKESIAFIKLMYPLATSIHHAHHSGGQMAHAQFLNGDHPRKTNPPPLTLTTARCQARENVKRVAYPALRGSPSGL